MSKIPACLIGKVVSWPNADQTNRRPARYCGYGTVVDAFARSILVRIADGDLDEDGAPEPPHYITMSACDETLRFFDTQEQHDAWLAFWRKERAEPSPLAEIRRRRGERLQ